MSEHRRNTRSEKRWQLFSRSVTPSTLEGRDHATVTIGLHGLIEACLWINGGGRNDEQTGNAMSDSFALQRGEEVTRDVPGRDLRVTMQAIPTHADSTPAADAKIRRAVAPIN